MSLVREAQETFIECSTGLYDEHYINVDDLHKRPIYPWDFYDPISPIAMYRVLTSINRMPDIYKTHPGLQPVKYVSIIENKDESMKEFFQFKNHE